MKTPTPGYLKEVPPVEPASEASAAAESARSKIKRLQAELEVWADVEFSDLLTKLDELGQVASSVAGGEHHKPGIRDLARRLSEECAGKAKTLQAISGRGLK